MSEQRYFDLPLQPSLDQGYTHLRVQVKFLRSKGVSLEVFPTKVDGAMSSIPFWSEERGILHLEEMQRLSRKRLDELLEACRAEIRSKQGRTWDHVAGILADKGLELA